MLVSCSCYAPSYWTNVPSIQQTAAIALGRLANYSEDLAEGVVGNEILPQLVYSLAEQNVSETEPIDCATSGRMQRRFVSIWMRMETVSL